MTDGARAGRACRLALWSTMALWAVGCAPPPVAEVYPQLGEYSGREIAEVEFLSPEPFDEDSLEALTETEATRCRILWVLPFCFPGTDWGRDRHYLSLRTIGSDLQRLNLLYRQTGYFGTEVVPEIEEVEGDGGPVAVSFVVRRGDGVVVDSVVVEGTEGIADPDSLEALLPLQSGELFHLGEFLASADTVRGALRARGHAYAEVLRNYAVDTIQDRATAWLMAIPGPRVVVDSIMIEGLDKLSRATTLRHVTFDQGDRLQLRELGASQRNLYELELVQFATVIVAPDSLQLTPDDSTNATVIIQVAEAPEHVVEAALGWGTIECGRATAHWTDRSFTGGARRLTLSGSVSRIGVGEPTDWTGSSLCPASRDTFATELDYRLAGELMQPYFLNVRNQLAIGAYAERESEPELFQRTAQGLRLNLNHRAAVREVLTASLDVERRVTRAIPALYCYAFLVCEPGDLRALGEPRWRNALGASWLRDRSNSVFNPTDGYIIRSAVQWATPLLGSSYDFVRTSADGSLYHELRPDWVLAGRLRLGTFLTAASIGADNFVAPEERFFAGGASSVRGFTRNDMGPGIWLYRNAEGVQPEDVDPSRGDLPVRFIPSGGTSVAVTSAELRFPSPVLSDIARFAVFVDAGTVGLEPLWKLDSNWLVTPGAGLRIRTPVGPARVDVAYNPYPHPRQPLFVPDPDTNALERVHDAYRPDDPSFRGRFRIHVAVGQAF